MIPPGIVILGLMSFSDRSLHRELLRVCGFLLMHVNSVFSFPDKTFVLLHVLQTLLQLHDRGWC